MLDHAGDDLAAAAAGKRAIAEDPGNALAYLNTTDAFEHLSRIREAAPYGFKAAQLGSIASGGLSPLGINTSRENLALAPAFTGDFQGALRQLKSASGPVYVGVREFHQGSQMRLLIAMHDISGARAVGANLPDSYFIAHFTQGAGLIAPEHLIAVQLENWPLALQLDDAMLATVDTNPEGKAVADLVRTRFILPLQATDLAFDGQLREAQAVAANLPLDCATCAEARMSIAALAHDYRAAFHWLSEARRWGGDRPFQPTQLGTILQNHGHYTAALQLADEAIRAGPKYSDALKLRGDALRKLNRLDEAADSYRSAADGAPRWGRLQIDWGFAEMRRGRWTDARRHLAAAGSTDLTAADRRLLAKLQPIAATR